MREQRFSGHCRRQILSGWPPVCTVTYEADRTVNGIFPKYFRPGSTLEYLISPIYGKNPATGGTPYYTPVLDSTDLAASTGPRSYTPYYEGIHQLSVQATINTTTCNIQPNLSAKPAVSIYAVKCLPKFESQQNPDDTVVIVHLPENSQQTIKVYAPAGPLTTAAQAAVNAWNSALQANGINVTMQLGACAVADQAYCVRVQEEATSDFGCAQIIHHGDPSTGVTDSSPLIRVPDDSWDQQYLNFLLAHELGHAVGLDENDCAADKTVMWGGVSPCGQFPTGTPAVMPTASDAVAAAMTPYRNGTTATCPAPAQ
jgi:hypothetical protein